MSYDLTDVTVSVFDIHTTVDIFQAQSAADYFQPAFTFLIDPAAYTQAFTLRKALKTAHFEFWPLPKRDSHTHFWDDYSDITHNGAKDIWKLQLPFVSRVSSVALAPNFLMPDVAVSVKAVIYLSALGWSTHILLRFRGSINNKQLIQVMERLMSKTPDILPLLVDGQAKNLTDTFRFFQELLLKEVYQPKNPPHKGQQIPRQYIVSLNQFNGQLFAYDDMPAADQMMLRSFLVGKNIDALQVDEEEQKRPLLPTQISPPYNFALTDFNHGTLIFLQRDAQDKTREGAVHCYHHNVRVCFMVAYSLLNFYNRSDDAAPQTRLSALREDILHTLKQIPKKYENQICQQLFTQHKDLPTRAAAK